jgi:hypothetical protein
MQKLPTPVWQSLPDVWARRSLSTARLGTLFLLNSMRHQIEMGLLVFSTLLLIWAGLNLIHIALS